MGGLQGLAKKRRSVFEGGGDGGGVIPQYTL